MVLFNPISGTTIGERGGVVPLSYHLAQAFLMHYPDEQYLKVSEARDIEGGNRCQGDQLQEDIFKCLYQVYYVCLRMDESEDCF